MNPRSPDFVHALTLVLNAAVSVARAKSNLIAQDPDGTNTSNTIAARQLHVLYTQSNTLRHDLDILAFPDIMSELYGELDKAISCGDVAAVERIRDRKLAEHSPEVSCVCEVDNKIRNIESQIDHLRSQLSELEGSRAHSTITALWSGITLDHIANATDRNINDVNTWLHNVYNPNLKIHPLHLRNISPMSLFDPNHNIEIFDNIVADLQEFAQQSLTTGTDNPVLDDGTEFKNYALEVDEDDPDGPTVLLEYGGPTTTLVWSDAIGTVDRYSTITLTRSLNNEKLAQHVFNDPQEVEQLSRLFFGNGALA